MKQRIYSISTIILEILLWYFVFTTIGWWALPLLITKIVLGYLSLKTPVKTKQPPIGVEAPDTIGKG